MKLLILSCVLALILTIDLKQSVAESDDQDDDQEPDDGTKSESAPLSAATEHKDAPSTEATMKEDKNKDSSKKDEKSEDDELDEKESPDAKDSPKLTPKDSTKKTSDPGDKSEDEPDDSETESEPENAKKPPSDIKSTVATAESPTKESTLRLSPYIPKGNCSQSCATTSVAKDPKLFTTNGELKVPTRMGVMHTICNHHYFFSRIPMNGQKAAQFCPLLGMRLLSLETQDELDCLVKNITSKSKQLNNLGFYVSGANTNCDNTFVWCPDMIPIFQSLPWFSGEPNNDKKQEHCMEMKFSKNSKNGVGFNDIKCIKESLFICQAKESELKLAPSELPAEIVKSECKKPDCKNLNIPCKTTKSVYFNPNGSLNVSPNQAVLLRTCGKRYIVGKKKSTIADAIKTCCQYGMRLITFETNEEVDCLERAYTAVSKMEIKFFTGGTDLNCHQVWWWCATDTPVVNNLRWATGEPDNRIKPEFSIGVFMRIGVGKSNFFDHNVFQTFNFLCEDNAEFVPDTPSAISEKSTTKQPSKETSEALKAPVTKAETQKENKKSAAVTVPTSSSAKQSIVKGSCLPTCGIKDCSKLRKNHQYYAPNGTFTGASAVTKVMETCGKLYLLITKKVTSLEAREQCCKYGLNMLNLDSIEELKCIDTAYKQNFKDANKFHTGGTSYSCPSVWYWCATKRPIQKDTCWLPGYPKDSSKGMDAIVGIRLHPQGETSGLFNFNVMEANGVMCEDILEPLVPPPAAESQTIMPIADTKQTCKTSECPPSKCEPDPDNFWTNGTLRESKLSYGLLLSACGHQFFISAEKKFQAAAAEACCSIGYRLFSLSSPEEQTCLTTSLRPYAFTENLVLWSAGWDQGCEGNFSWCWSSWDAGRLSSQLTWLPGQPNNLGEKENGITLSVQMKKSSEEGLADAPSKSAKRFLCKAKQNNNIDEIATTVTSLILQTQPPLSPASADTSCVSRCPAYNCTLEISNIQKDNTIAVPASEGVVKQLCNHRYLFSKKKRNFTQAAESCCSLNMTLLVLTTQDDQICTQNVFKDNMKGAKTFWTGGAECGKGFSWCKSGSAVPQSQLTWREKARAGACLAIAVSSTIGDSMGLFAEDCTKLMTYICYD